VKPAAKRKVVRHIQEQHSLSQRRACRLVGCNGKSARHVSKRGDDGALRVALKQLAEKKTAWGYRMLQGGLRLDGWHFNHKGWHFNHKGWHFNHKKAHRLYREEKLVLRKKNKKRLKCEKRGPVQAATAPGQKWVMDFIHDRLADGRGFRTLNLSDSVTRQCLGQEVDSSLSGQRVVRLLDQVAQKQGLPELIQMDNGPEFRSKALDLWAYKNKVKLDFIEPGKPTQNGHIESFNGRFRAECLDQVRAECLDQEWFGSLQQAREMIQAWRISYNTQRPHSSLGYVPPDVWTQKYYQQPQNLML
jgi:putative transposase